jgi:hypothetical protein
MKRINNLWACEIVFSNYEYSIDSEEIKIIENS